MLIFILGVLFIVSEDTYDKNMKEISAINAKMDSIQAELFKDPKLKEVYLKVTKELENNPTALYNKMLNVFKEVSKELKTPKEVNNAKKVISGFKTAFEGYIEAVNKKNDKVISAKLADPFDILMDKGIQLKAFPDVGTEIFDLISLSYITRQHAGIFPDTDISDIFPDGLK